MGLYILPLQQTYYAGQKIVLDSTHGSIILDWEAIGGAGTATAGLSLQNNTAATAGVPVQSAPGLEFIAHSWNTAGPNDAINSIYIDVEPLSYGYTAPRLMFYSRQDGAAYSLCGFIQPYSSTFYLADGTNSSAVTISQTQVNLYSGGSNLTVNSTGATGSSPSSAGRFATDDSTGSVLVYSSNSIVLNTTTITITAAGAGGLVISGPVNMSTTSGDALVVTQASSANYSALVLFEDNNGRAHFGVDAAGLPSLGSRYEWRENWVWSGALGASYTTNSSPVLSTSTGWYMSNTGTTPFLANASTNGFIPSNAPWECAIQASPGTVNGNTLWFTTYNYVFNLANLTNQYMVWEWDLSLTAGSGTGTNVTWYHGVTPNLSPGSSVHPGGFYFQKASGDAEWQYVVDNKSSAQTTAATGWKPGATAAGGAAADGVMQTFRIEFYGSASFTAANTVRFYINNALIATVTTNIYTGATPYVWTFAAKNTNTPAPLAQSMVISPLTTTFNRVAAALQP